jgi:uncharacterized protein YecE (DUF72 family)
MVSVSVGSCSWTDRTLIACKRFYPKGCSTAEARLRFYSTQFPLVEVDSSFYAMPSRSNSTLWAERTPTGFAFNLKAFRLFTNHPTTVAALPADIQHALQLAPTARLYYRDVPQEIRGELWRRFRDALEPLQTAEKLKLVHFQFPPWLTRTASGHQHVRHCVEMMGGQPVSVEFRNRIWFEGAHTMSTLAFERELGVVHTVVDAPPGFGNSVPAVWRATNDRFALVRLHGRNATSWSITNSTASSDRFNYDYPDSELQDLVEPIRHLARGVLETHVVFNNNMEDQGQRNAQRMSDLLRAADVSVVVPRPGPSMAPSGQVAQMLCV